MKNKRPKIEKPRFCARIKARYLVPKLLKGERSNIEWDAYPEDAIFKNEPKR